jgi:uncharacterized membrane protein
MNEHERLREGSALERVVFFSDAVFAIAVTLLVIDLRLPDLGARPSDQELSAALSALVPRIFAYVLSFGVVGLYWVAHWRRFHYIERVDEPLVVLNLLLLGLIAFIPFPTSLIGQHGDRPFIVAVYALTLAAAGLIGPLTWFYARRRGLVSPDLPADYVRVASLRAFAVPAVMLGSLVLLPIVGPFWVEASWFLILPIQFAFVRGRFAGRSHTT